MEISEALYASSSESVDGLEQIRQVQVVRFSGEKGLRVRHPLEEMDSDTKALAQALGITG